MLEFYRTKTRLLLSSGKTVTIQRGGLGRLFDLYDSLLEQNILVLRIGEPAGTYTVDEYKQMVSRLEHIQHEINSLLPAFIMDDGEYTNIERNEIIREIFKHNFKSDKKQAAETPDIAKLYEIRDSLEQNHNLIVARLAEKCGWTIDYIENKISYHQATAILTAMKHNRAEYVADTAAAFSTKPSEYINKLLEVKTYTAQEFMAMMKARLSEEKLV